MILQCNQCKKRVLQCTRSGSGSVVNGNEQAAHKTTTYGNGNILAANNGHLFSESSVNTSEDTTESISI